MKKLIIYLFLTICCKAGFSQSHDEYVEVTVEDTLKIDPEIIDYTVLIEPTFSYSYVDSASVITTVTTSDKKSIDDQNSKEENLLKERTDNLLAIIKKYKIDTVENDLSKTTLINGYFGRGRTITLRFKSIEQFKLVEKDLKKVNGIRGEISFLQNSKLNQYYPTLIHKILFQAQFNAMSIASQCNKKLGKIISLKEEKLSVGGWTSYPPLSALVESSQGNFSDQIILERKVTIRYSWQ